MFEVQRKINVVLHTTCFPTKPVDHAQRKLTIFDFRLRSAVSSALGRDKAMSVITRQRSVLTNLAAHNRMMPSRGQLKLFRYVDLDFFPPQFRTLFWK